nr:hypothetical protein [Escherichia coli]
MTDQGEDQATADDVAAQGRQGELQQELGPADFPGERQVAYLRRKKKPYNATIILVKTKPCWPTVISSKIYTVLCSKNDK